QQPRLREQPAGDHDFLLVAARQKPDRPFQGCWRDVQFVHVVLAGLPFALGDRKSTRLNSSHVKISYAVFCLKKKKTRLKRNSLTERDRTRKRRRMINRVETYEKASYRCMQTINKKNNDISKYEYGTTRSASD